MSATTEADQGKRIATLDIIRGVAVMGIFGVNVIAFAMPIQAYFNPIGLRPRMRRPISPCGSPPSS